MKQSSAITLHPIKEDWTKISRNCSFRYGNGVKKLIATCWNYREKPKITVGWPELIIEVVRLFTR